MIDDDDPDLLARLDARLADRVSTRPTLWQVVQRNRQYLKSKIDEGYTYSDIAEALREEGYLHASAQNVGAAYRASDGKKQIKKLRNSKLKAVKSVDISKNESEVSKNIPSTRSYVMKNDQKILGERPSTIGNDFFEK